MSLTSAFYAGLCRLGGTRVCLECLVYLADVGDLAGLDRQVMAHEAVEMRAVGVLPEIHLHWPPILFVKARLQLRLQAHQDEVADEVGLAQLAASRVHALEDELRIVLFAVQGDVHDHQFCQTPCRRSTGRRCNSAIHASKRAKFSRHPKRSFLRRFVIAHDGNERCFVGLGQDQFVMPLSRLFGIERGSSCAICAARSHRRARVSPSAFAKRGDEQRRPRSTVVGRRSRARATGA